MSICCNNFSVSVSYKEMLHCVTWGRGGSSPYWSPSYSSDWNTHYTQPLETTTNDEGRSVLKSRVLVSQEWFYKKSEGKLLKIRLKCDIWTPNSSLPWAEWQLKLRCLGLPQWSFRGGQAVVFALKSSRDYFKLKFK